MNSLQLPLGALFELTAQIYDFVINKGVDLASTVRVELSADGQADIYIFCDGSAVLTPFDLSSSS